MELKYGKKGIFYLFVSAIFLFAIVLVFFISESYDYRESQESVFTRIQTMNDFVNDLNNDAKKATYIAAYRALIAMEEEIALTGEYFSDVNPVFVEAFYNGTINGLNKTVLNASSFSDYLTRVNITANSIGIRLDVEVKNVSLYHVDPWEIAVRVQFTNNVTDLRGLASWNYEKDQETMVPIYDLRDPLYSVATFGRVPNTIRRPNVTYFIDDTSDANDTTNLMAHTNDSFYFATKMAPSYVMRLEGNFTSSPYGIESLVNIPKLQEQSLPIDSTRSIVDYIYFDTNLTNASSVCFAIIETPAWFRIDQDHLKTYEIDPKLNPAGVGYQCP